MDPAKSPGPWKPDPLCDWARFEVTGDALFWTSAVITVPMFAPGLAIRGICLESPPTDDATFFRFSVQRSPTPRRGSGTLMGMSLPLPSQEFLRGMIYPCTSAGKECLPCPSP
jgi:hypothetical protein